MDTLVDPQKAPGLRAQIRRESELELGRAAAASVQAAPQARSTVPPADFIPRPPAWGPRVVRQMPLDAVFQCLPKNELFRLSWGAKNTHGEAWEKLEAEYEERLDSMRRQALQEEWLKPQGVYGYWPVNAEGNDLVVYDPLSVQTGSPVEAVRFSFPRQPSGDNLCLADYFLPAGSERMDVVAFQIVTIGKAANDRIERLQSASDYSEAYFTHGLAVQMAEAAAEYLHRHIRHELNLAPEQGKRYSWGYPAIPELQDHQLVFQLLPVESELGMSLTPAYQLVPEQSTAAIILHHPAAKYFTVGETRIAQLMS